MLWTSWATTWASSSPVAGTSRWTADGRPVRACPPCETHVTASQTHGHRRRPISMSSGIYIRGQMPQVTKPKHPQPSVSVRDVTGVHILHSTLQLFQCFFFNSCIQIYSLGAKENGRNGRRLFVFASKIKALHERPV